MHERRRYAELEQNLLPFVSGRSAKLGEIALPQDPREIIDLLGFEGLSLVLAKLPGRGLGSVTYLDINMPSILSSFLEVADDTLDAIAHGRRVVRRFTAQGHQNVWHPSWWGARIGERLDQSTQT